MDSPRAKSAWLQALAYAWQFGYTIAVPLVVLAIAGRLLDRHFGTKPWLFLIGIFLSIILSSAALLIKALSIMRSVTRETSKRQSDDHHHMPHS